MVSPADQTGSYYDETNIMNIVSCYIIAELLSSHIVGVFSNEYIEVTN